jgi:hypothetical protein
VGTWQELEEVGPSWRKQISEGPVFEGYTWFPVAPSLHMLYGYDILPQHRPRINGAKNNGGKSLKL